VSIYKQQHTSKSYCLGKDIRWRAFPAFVMNQDKLVGAQPYEMLVKLVEANGAKKRKET